MERLIRKETPADYEAIAFINDLAFGQPQEGKLVAALRQNERFVDELSLVCIENGTPAGHILFFPLFILSGDSRIETLSLGPMSVIPGYQNNGIGSALIINGLAVSYNLGYRSVVVLGHPGYYPRFGFRKAGMWGINAPFDTTDEALMAMELVTGSLGSEGGTVEYLKEYYDAL